MSKLSLGSRVIWKAYKIKGKIIDWVGEQAVVLLDEPKFDKVQHRLFKEELETPMFTQALLEDGHREMSEGDYEVPDSPFKQIVFFIQNGQMIQAIKVTRLQLNSGLLNARFHLKRYPTVNIKGQVIDARW